MKVRFWGVRGSYPVPGASTSRYGGNTSCIEVRPGDGSVVILDAGTGIRKLGRSLGERCDATVLVTHTHWDHIQGLPFFAPLAHAGSRVEIVGPHHAGRSLADVFDAQWGAPPACDVSYIELVDGASVERGAVRITCARLNHPFVAVGYRVECGGRAVAYVTDTAPFRDQLFDDDRPARLPLPPLGAGAAARLAAMRDAVVRLCAGADLVVYDTMFTVEDYALRPHWGHSCPDDAIAVCRDAGARALALFHHAPDRTDDAVDAMLADARARAGAGLAVHAAAESHVLVLDEAADLGDAERAAWT